MHADYVWCKSRLCGNVRAFEKVNPCPPLFVSSAAPTSLQDPAALPVLVKRRLHGDSKMGVLKRYLRDFSIVKRGFFSGLRNMLSGPTGYYFELR
jgi:hypothetical protein